MPISLTLLGTGGPRTNRERSQTAMLVDVDGYKILVDCGEGALRRLLEISVAPEEISALIFTHLHVDHTFGYPAVIHAAWFNGRGHLPVYGPAGTRALTEDLFDRAFGPDIRSRTDKGRPSTQFIQLDVEEIRGAGIVMETAQCTVTAQPVLHDAPSETYALRFTDRHGHSVVISSDTAYCEALAQFAHGTDLLLHACYLHGAAFNNWKPAFQDLLRSVHCTPEEAGEIARLAGAGHLVLTHFLAGVDEPTVLEQVRTQYTGPVTVGWDLLSVRVPEG